MEGEHAEQQTIGLKRSLHLWDLIVYGIILIQPTAPTPVFGVLHDKSHGHTTATILLALVAVLLTAFSYGRMARAYPQGGSAFLYVGKEIHPSLGYLTGWCLVMDYILNPLICTIWCIMTQELAILRKHQPNAFAFLVDRCDVSNRAVIARNHRLDKQIVEAGRILAVPRPVSPHGYALFIRTHAKYPTELWLLLGSERIVAQLDVA